MKAIDLPGKNLVLAKDQPEYNQLPVCYEPTSERPMTSCFKLSWKERLKMFITGKIFIQQLTFGQLYHPIKPMVDFKEPACCNCHQPISTHKGPHYSCPVNLN